jgi:hypothetical protein
MELGEPRLGSNGSLINGLSQPELVRIMLWSCTRQVTEPIDQIWALMGLAQPELRHSVSLVDYSQSGRSNFFAMYKAFTKIFLLQDEHLWMLPLIALTLRDQGLLSWCPNFCHVLMTTISSCYSELAEGTNYSIRVTRMQNP